jgi:hypothetical protein
MPWRFVPPQYVLRSVTLFVFFGWLALARVTGPVGAAVTQAQRR